MDCFSLSCLLTQQNKTFFLWSTSVKISFIAALKKKSLTLSFSCSCLPCPHTWWLRCTLKFPYMSVSGYLHVIQIHGNPCILRVKSIFYVVIYVQIYSQISWMIPGIQMVPVLAVLFLNAHRLSHANICLSFGVFPNSAIVFTTIYVCLLSPMLWPHQSPVFNGSSVTPLFFSIDLWFTNKLACS